MLKSSLLNKNSLFSSKTLHIQITENKVKSLSNSYKFSYFTAARKFKSKMHLQRQYIFLNFYEKSILEL
jgi:hypothetical protein